MAAALTSAVEVVIWERLPPCYTLQLIVSERIGNGGMGQPRGDGDPPVRPDRESDVTADLAYIHRRRRRAEECKKLWLGLTLAALMGTATNWPTVVELLVRFIQWLDQHLSVSWNH